jgi:hypothetical protein
MDVELNNLINSAFHKKRDEGTIMAEQQEVLEEQQVNDIQQQPEQEQYSVVEEQQFVEQPQEPQKETEQKKENHGPDRSGFLHGLSVGLGIGCIATFVIMWIAIFFTPLIPNATTYENLLAVFIYPLIYLLAVGLVALTAGVVREYYSRVQ